MGGVGGKRRDREGGERGTEKRIVKGKWDSAAHYLTMVQERREREGPRDPERDRCRKL